MESDFVLWHKREEVAPPDCSAETVFGESKSFIGRFKQDDVNKMKKLAETFPGSIMVFAALKDGADFSKKEIDRLKKFAEWGREYDEDKEQSRAPVIILTQTELFAEVSLGQSWMKKRGKHNQLLRSRMNSIGSIGLTLDNLRFLADLTQQLYLGMPSYDSHRRS